MDIREQLEAQGANVRGEDRGLLLCSPLLENLIFIAAVCSRVW